MRIKLFGKKISDVLKVAEFMDKNGITFELVSDVEFDIEGDISRAIEGDEPSKEKMVPTVERVRVTSSDPLWRVAQHDNKVCQDTNCKDVTHYGAVAMGV
jgi:peroxiredoxin